MVDVLKNTIGEDERIDPGNETQCEHWAAQFDVNTDELRQALRQAGNRIADLHAYFANRANRS